MEPITGLRDRQRTDLFAVWTGDTMKLFDFWFTGTGAEEENHYSVIGDKLID